MERNDFSALVDALYYLKTKSVGLKIKGESIDTNFSGTYDEVNKKYRKLSRKLHPDFFEANRNYR